MRSLIFKNQRMKNVRFTIIFLIVLFFQQGMVISQTAPAGFTVTNLNTTLPHHPYEMTINQTNGNIYYTGTGGGGFMGMVNSAGVQTTVNSGNWASMINY